MLKLPAPLTSPEVDLTDFQFMPLDVRRIRDSRIASAISGEGFRCAVLLWCSSWHQIPAASLPDDDLELSQLAGFGRAISEWKKVREEALYGWVKCDDGRLYHPVVAEKAAESWAEKLSYRWRKECDRVRKLNKQREKDRLPLLPLPTNPMETARVPAETKPIPTERDGPSDGKPPDDAGRVDGIPAENALKGQGQGQGQGLVPFSNEKGPPDDAETELYRRGRDVLGKSSGGMVKRLLEAKGGKIADARAAIEMAAGKSDPREYIGAIVRGQRERSQDALRAAGEAW